MFSQKVKNEKGAVEFSSTENPFLDAFYLLKRIDLKKQQSRDKSSYFDLITDQIKDLLTQCWNLDANKTLKLIASFRVFREKGKGERDLTRYCLRWLAINHPKTFLLNIAEYIKFGRYDDILLVALAEGGYPGLPDHGVPYFVQLEVCRFYVQILEEDRMAMREYIEWKKKISEVEENNVAGEKEFKYEGRKATLCAKWIPTEKSGASRFGMMKRKKNDAYADDSMEDQNKNEVKNEITNNESYRPEIIHKIALCLSSRDHSIRKPKKNGDKFLSYALQRLRKEYLSPLREHLKVVERLMSNNRWSEVVPLFEKIPGRAMNKYSHKFVRTVARGDTHQGSFWRHDQKEFKQGFSEYMKRVSEGKSDIKGAKVLTPPDLASYYLRQVYQGYQNKLPELDPTVEAQWVKVIENMSENHVADDVVVMVDNSGSMFSTMGVSNGMIPIYASIGIGLAITASQKRKLTEQAWNALDRVDMGYKTTMRMRIPPSVRESLMKYLGITDSRQLYEKHPLSNTLFVFSEDCKVHTVTETRLRDQIYSLPQDNSCTNLMSAFRKLIQMQTGLRYAECTRILFIISDGQFDPASIMVDRAIGESNQNKKSNHLNVAEKMFREANMPMPTVIMWNVSDRYMNNIPICRDDATGVLLISGYSSSLYQLVMDAIQNNNLDKISPMSLVEEALNQKEFQNLRVDPEELIPS